MARRRKREAWQREILLELPPGRAPRLVRSGKHRLGLSPKDSDGEAQIVLLDHPALEDLDGCLWRKALELGEGFLGYEPKSAYFMDAEAAPDFVLAVGTLLAVEYDSPKWDHQFKTFRHEFGPERPLLATHPDGRPLYILGGNYVVTLDRDGDCPGIEG